MPKKLKRYYGRGDLHFLTFSCYRRLPLLRTIRARNVFVQALGKILARFWQPRFYDFNVYSEKKKREKLEYMHRNPVNRGVVKDPGAWMWSSYLYYARGEAGLVTIDPVD
jgi:putative transposase